MGAKKLQVLEMTELEARFRCGQGFELLPSLYRVAISVERSTGA